MAIIDGCHDYQHVYFDAISAAALLRPGGLVLLDNIEDVGPYWAGREFLKLKSAWKELGEGLQSFSRSSPFDAPHALLETNLAVLQAPVDLVLNDRPHSTGNQPYYGDCVSGIKFDVAGIAPRGRLHIQLTLRGFADGVQPQTQKWSQVAELDVQSAYIFKLQSPLRTSVSASLPNYRQLVEIVMFWQPLEPGKSLHLLAAPEPYE